MNKKDLLNFGGSALYFGSVLPADLTPNFTLTVMFVLTLGLLGAYCLKECKEEV